MPKDPNSRNEILRARANKNPNSALKFDQRVAQYLFGRLAAEPEEDFDLRDLNRELDLRWHIVSCHRQDTLSLGDIFLRLTTSPVWDRIKAVKSDYRKPPAVIFNTGGLGNWIIVKNEDPRFFDHVNHFHLTIRGERFNVLKLTDFASTLKELR